MLAFVAILAFLVQPDTTFRAPPEASDSTVVEEVAEEAQEIIEDVTRLRVRPVFSPTTLYSPARGFGIGGGIAMDHALSSGDHLQIEARVSERLQGGFAEYTTGRPGEEPLVGVFGGAFWTTSRTLFEGHGPHSAADGELWLDRLASEAEARIAWAPAGPRGLLLQPTVRFSFDRLRDYEETSPGGLDLVLQQDSSRLDESVGTDLYGAEAALSAILDTRDFAPMPTRGTYLEGEVGRFQSLDGTGLGYTRAQTLLYAFRPALFHLPFLPEPGALFVRASGVVTREDGAGQIPWVYLPQLDRDLLVGYPRSAFVGRDAISLGLGARGVIGEAIGAFLFEGVVVGIVGAAYDDVFTEFTPKLTFKDERAPAGEAVPLRPSLGVGLNLHFIDRQRPLLGALLGVGPGGVTLASLRLVYGLDDYRPRLR